MTTASCTEAAARAVGAAADSFEGLLVGSRAVASTPTALRAAQAWTTASVSVPHHASAVGLGRGASAAKPSPLRAAASTSSVMAGRGANAARSGASPDRRLPASSVAAMPRGVWTAPARITAAAGVTASPRGSADDATPVAHAHAALLGATAPEVAALLPGSAAAPWWQHGGPRKRSGADAGPRAVIAVTGETLSELLALRDALVRAGAPLVVALRPGESSWLRAETAALRSLAQPPRRLQVV